MQTLDVIKTRRSTREFSDRRVSEDILEQIIDCARMAPTANNIQPWEFIVVTQGDLLKEISDITDHGKFISGAPVCIAVFCRKTKYYLEDGSAATENILLAGHALGLGSCWVAGDKKNYADKIRELLGVPENLVLVSLIAMGFSSDKVTPAKRKLDEVLHWQKFNRRD